MLRQRLRERTSPLVFVGRLVTLVFALALVWYGLMTVLLALKVSPSMVNAISGYRTAFDWLSGLTPSDVDGAATRAIIAAAGVVAFLVFGYLALKQLPRPYLARRELELTADERGEVTVEPRAVERLAEVAATTHPAGQRAQGRYSSDDLSVDLPCAAPRPRRHLDRRPTLRRPSSRQHDCLSCLSTSRSPAMTAGTEGPPVITSAVLSCSAFSRRRLDRLQLRYAILCLVGAGRLLRHLAVLEGELDWRRPVAHPTLAKRFALNAGCAWSLPITRVRAARADRPHAGKTLSACRR